MVASRSANENEFSCFILRSGSINGVTDNALLIRKLSRVNGFIKILFSGGAVAGGGLVIANAPNPAGFEY